MYNIMTIPLNEQLTQFLKSIHNDKNGNKIMEIYRNNTNILTYILNLNNDEMSEFYQNYKIYIDINQEHIKQIVKYAKETNDDRPILFKLTYGFWLYSHTSNLI